MRNWRRHKWNFLVGAKIMPLFLGYRGFDYAMDPLLFPLPWGANSLGLALPKKTYRPSLIPTPFKDQSTAAKGLGIVS